MSAGSSSMRHASEYGLNASRSAHSAFARPDLPLSEPGMRNMRWTSAVTALSMRAPIDREASSRRAWYAAYPAWATAAADFARADFGPRMCLATRPLQPSSSWPGRSSRPGLEFRLNPYESALAPLNMR